METPELTIDPEFWDRTENTALLNPRTPGASELRHALEEGADQAGLRGHCIFATSGTTGLPKFACLSRSALLASAAAVNAHLQADPADRWFCALPVFHVGGIGVWARTHLLECALASREGRWNAGDFCDQLAASAATLSAIVPTQVHDLVTARLRCPNAVRAILVGGGALNRNLLAQALELGWPLLETFGMTEAASQIATQTLDEIGDLESGLKVLSVWEVRNSANGPLEIRGKALFSGYLRRASADTGAPFAFVRAAARDGWFTTSDRVCLTDATDGVRLIPMRRTDETVKILGENVDLRAIQEAVDPTCETVIIAALPDARTGSRLVASIESDHLQRLGDVQQRLRRHNSAVAPHERVSSLAVLPFFPRSELGKVAKHQLISALGDLKSFKDVN